MWAEASSYLSPANRGPRAYVYWSNFDDQQVQRVGYDGGTALPLAQNESSPDNITLDAGYVYWNNGQVRRVGKAGGSVQTIGTGASGSFAVSAKYVVWTDPASGRIIKWVK